ncbi:MAG TPA: hypothetical protein PKI89_07515, partial [Tepidiformaceae bacterium]|nr:hypothetical protein [Tepidiformaceae bacterium]
TLNLDDDLLKAAKIAAIREGVTLTALVEAALRERIDAARTTEWEIPAHIDRDDPAAVAEFIAELANRKDRRGDLGPPKRVRGEPCAGIDFRSTAELLEAAEKPFVRR